MFIYFDWIFRATYSTHDDSSLGPATGLNDAVLARSRVNSSALDGSTVPPFMPAPMDDDCIEAAGDEVDSHGTCEELACDR